MEIPAAVEIPVPTVSAVLPLDETSNAARKYLLVVGVALVVVGVFLIVRNK